MEEGPFLTSTWSQGGYGGNYVWDYYTPNHYVCGCVATAMGQILKYYEWPITGTGSHSYTWDNGEDPSQVLSADFGATTYAWSDMLDNYATTTTETQREAAGELAYQCGVSVDMNYTSGGSGANCVLVASSLEDYFRHSGEWVSNSGNFYDRLYDNMLDHRPAELAISRTGGGHAVVADGVRHEATGSKWYHLNMGWFGTDDAWYDLPDITTPSGNPDYDTVDGAVLDIVPTPDMTDPGTTINNPNVTVSWQVSDNLDASHYELQELVVPDAIDDFFDGAESGDTGNWEVDGNWEATTSKKYTGSYAFRCYHYPGSQFTSTFLLDKAIKIHSSTDITYRWGINYVRDYEVQFQVSTDASSWTALATYDLQDDDGTINWYEETSLDLSSYVGDIVYLRFVWEFPGGSYFDGATYSQVGFFLDDFSIDDAYIGGSWTTVDNTITPTSKTVSLTQNGDHRYRVRANWNSQWWDWSDAETVTVSGLCNSATTGDWDSGDTWDGSVPGTSDSAIIRSGHTVTVTSNAQCHGLAIESGGTLVVSDGVTLSIAGDWVKDGTFTPNNGTVAFNGSSAQTIGGSSATGFNNLTVNSGAIVDIETTPTVAGTLTNNGTLQQTQDVNGSSDVSFFNTGGYGGVTLNANGTNLGSTIVNIEGNQDCTDGASGSSIKRCFNIAPENTSGLNATMRLYFSDSELGTIIPCDQVQLWHWDGDDWVSVGTIDPGSGRQCGTEPYYVEATGVSSFSPFVGDNNKPGGGPTIVTLASFVATLPRFGARTAGGMNGFVLPLALVALCVVGGALLLRARR